MEQQNYKIGLDKKNFEVTIEHFCWKSLDLFLFCSFDFLNLVKP